MAAPGMSPDLFSPRFWQRFVAPCVKRIVDESPIPIVLHILGKTDPTIGMKKAVETAHAKGVTVFGNVATPLYKTELCCIYALERRKTWRS